MDLAFEDLADLLGVVAVDRHLDAPLEEGVLDLGGCLLECEETFAASHLGQLDHLGDVLVHVLGGPPMALENARLKFPTSLFM